MAEIETRSCERRLFVGEAWQKCQLTVIHTYAAILQTRVEISSGEISGYGTGNDLESALADLRKELDKHGMRLAINRFARNAFVSGMSVSANSCYRTDSPWKVHPITDAVDMLDHCDQADAVSLAAQLAYLEERMRRRPPQIRIAEFFAGVIEAAEGRLSNRRRL